MRPDQWIDTRDRIKEQCVVIDEGEAPLEDVPNGHVAFVVFESPVGRVRLEYVTKPRTLGERAVTSRRIGGATAIEKIYDTEDMVQFLRAFRWDPDTLTWVSFRAEGIV